MKTPPLRAAAIASRFEKYNLLLPADQAAELEKVAEIDRVPVSEAVRDAIAKHIESPDGTTSSAGGSSA